MSKKDKKIEIQLADAKVEVSGQIYEGYSLSMGKRDIGQIAEISANQFAIVKNGTIEAFFKTLEKAVETIIENYNLNH
ncbi:DUF2969 domain-containing protein [Streptococcus ovuberis]|uniref:DUF2969 domain-containing protein n=1 Tax=Streptococcus ovuberis TaxID=1936207 RepID=A0A7X6MZA7_9STRE|nr:DUF2969 domain-containing protein [Streptococcus ovuberis]NKZ20444.1 DUF2969 domain-containing protein [Streptococcus ovuberis]